MPLVKMRGGRRKGKLSKEEKKLLLMHKNHKIKYVKKPMYGIIHPKTGKTVKYITLNLPVNKQMRYAELYRKGYITGVAMGRGHITKKGKEALR